MIDITRKFAESLDLDSNEAQFLAEVVRSYEGSFLDEAPKTHKDRFPLRFDDVVAELIKNKDNWANEGVPYETQRIILNRYMEYLEATAANSRNSEAYLSDTSVIRRLQTDRGTILETRRHWIQNKGFGTPDSYSIEDVDEVEEY